MKFKEGKGLARFHRESTYEYTNEEVATVALALRDLGVVRRENAELRKLVERIVANDRHFVPDLDVDGLAADALREHEAIVAAAKEYLSSANKEQQ